MKLLAFSGRNVKEILRDPLTAAFSLGFPVILLLLMSAIQANVPVSLFEIATLTPGITVFGLSFMTLFSATLIAKDRETALLQRLYTTPLTAADFIFGYALPLLPISVAQGAVCYLVALLLGLPATVTVVYAVLFVLPSLLGAVPELFICVSDILSEKKGKRGRLMAAAVFAAFGVAYYGCLLAMDGNGVVPYRTYETVMSEVNGE